MWYVSVINTEVTSPMIRWIGGPLQRQKQGMSLAKEYLFLMYSQVSA